MKRLLVLVSSLRPCVLLLGCACTALLLVPGVALGATPVADPDGVLPSQIAQLLAGDGAKNDLLGYSAAISGDTAVVGARDADILTHTAQGAAYVFVRSDGAWTQQAKLTASGNAGDYFGWSVAISGDTVVVGAPFANGATQGEGAAYVFTRSGTTWTQQEALASSNAAADDHFGYSVAVSGDTVVVGADNVSGAEWAEGAAYIFTRSGTTWTQQPKLTAPDAAADDHFGCSVAVADDTVVVGTNASNAGIGRAYVFTRSGTSWSQQDKLTAADGAAGDQFGTSVGISGDTVVVGADTANGGAGAAYVFTRSGTSWSEQKKLSAADGAAGDAFGYTVAVSGETVVVGAPDMGWYPDRGAAYVFVRSGTAWSQQKELTAADGGAGDRFGHSVAVAGETVVVGARDIDIGANANQGAAYVFSPYVTLAGSALSIPSPGVLANDSDDDGHTLTAKLVTAPAHGTVVLAADGGFTYTPAARYRGSDTFTYRASDGRLSSEPALVTIRVDAAPVANPDGALPSQIAQLLADDGAAGDYFGSSVAVSGDTVVVSTPRTNADRGTAYVFVRARAGWVEQARLTASDGVPGDWFGQSVAISGDTVVVGAPIHNIYAGAAYVFVRSGSIWTQQAKLEASDSAAYDRFGASVAVSGDTVVVGAHYRDSGRGAAYVFVRSGTTWKQQHRLTASDGVAHDLFGASVAVSGDTVVVGAYYDNSLRGAAYVFVRSGTAWTQQKKLTASDGANNDWLGMSVALCGDTAVVGAQHANGGRGAAYVFVRSGTTWAQQKELTAPDGADDDRFGHSVALSGDTAYVGAYLHDVGPDEAQGAVYAFTRSGTTWTLQQELCVYDGEEDDYFGESVAVASEMVVVGAYGDDLGVHSMQGSAYVFTPYTTPADSILTVLSPGVLANDSDAEGAALSAQLVTPPAHGSVVLVESGRFHYTPTAGFLGTDSFTYRASDGRQYSAPATVTIAVEPANTPPVAVPDGLRTQVAHLLAPLGPSTEFVSTIAVSGDTLVLGCGDERVGGNGYQGAAHVYVRLGTAWVEQATLSAADGEALDWFGSSVAVSGETIAVGVPGDDVGGNADQGSVRVFVRAGGIWAPQQTLTAADGEAGDIFGQALALAGETLVATAPHDGVGANAYQGSAHVFARSGGLWSPEARLTAPSGAAADFFGTAVAIEGDTVVVGDAAAPIRGNQAQGSAFVFVRGGGAWPLQGYLTVADGAAYDYFGRAVAVSGDTVLVGALSHDVDGRANQGTAYVFARAGNGTWSQQQELLADDGQAGDNFGDAVGVWGETAVVGAMNDDVGAEVDQGSVRVFTRAGATWAPQPALTGAGTAANDFFGASLAIEAETIVVGAYHWDRSADTGQHSAFVFAPGYVAYENTPLHVRVPGLLANDSDADGDVLSSFTVSGPLHGTVSVTAEGSFVYVPQAGFTGDDGFTYRAWDGEAYSDPAAVGVRVLPGSPPAATTLTLKGPAGPPAFNTPTNLRATLRTASGPVGAGHSVLFERYGNGQWLAAGSATTDAAGVARRSTGGLTTATRFRARFAGEAALAPCDSAALTVAPKAWLTTPSAPKAVSAGKAFTSTGYLKPRHTAGTYPVRLQCFRREQQANGSYKWVLRKTVSARAADYSTYTRYSAKVTLSSKGTWRMRARHLDASHALTYSGWRYLTVK